MEDPTDYANRAIVILDKLMDKQFSTDRILAMAQVYATLAVWEELKRGNDLAEREANDWKIGR